MQIIFFFDLGKFFVNSLAKKLITGTVSKKEYSRVWYLNLAFGITCWTISRLYFSDNGGFVIEEHLISTQGDLNLNPIGGWFFIVSTTITGFVVCFFFAFLYQCFKSFSTIQAPMMLLFGVIGGL